MDALFWIKCSSSMASALGAKPFVRIPRPDLSFPVYQPRKTHHAMLYTEEGPFAWFWTIDKKHPLIERS